MESGLPEPVADQLIERLAAVVLPRDPGWRLPRRAALARKLDAGLTELDRALTELVRRSMIRRLPDGQLYRTSPAGRWVPVEGAAGLATRLDPMGNTIDRAQREVYRRPAPADVAEALGLPDGATVLAVRSLWAADGEPVAEATAYRADDADAEAGGEAEPEFPEFATGQQTLAVAEVRVQAGPAATGTAATLAVPAGWPVVTVTVRSAGPPLGFAVLTMRAERFRIAVERLNPS